MAKTDPPWQPSEAEFQRVLREQNPWQEEGAVPSAWAMSVERPLARFLPRRLFPGQLRRFQLILGPRRVGKTTLMYQVVRRLMGEGVPHSRLWWLRLDHPMLMRDSLEAIVRPLVQRTSASPDKPLFLFLDELSYAAQWDLWLKTFYDQRWPVCIAGTSSSTAALRDRMLESGVGRWEEQYLPPYSFSEYLGLIGKAPSVPAEDSLAQTLDRLMQSAADVADGLEAQRRRFLLMGGFPEILEWSRLSGGDEQTLLLQSQKILRTDAVERAIYKDIPQAFGVHDTMLLERLLYALAGQFCGVLSPSNICQSLGGLTPSTFERYLNYLERAFLVFTLMNYSGSEMSRQKRGRKLYFVDGAVRNAALQRGVGPLHDPVEMGLLQENLVAGHLHALAQQTGVRIYYWRDGNSEIDLVYDHPESPLAFEVASSPMHSRRGIEAFVRRFPRFAGRCYMVLPRTAPLRPQHAGDGVGHVSIDLLLLAAGAQAEHGMGQRMAVG